uniref:Tetratricopeptide repeat domain 37 n=1 Tax=Electrophorus electricus TaxID=8005 RepID=A0A4W4FY58_ELEEL
MSNKEVKSALKSAREAIKNKEFKEALKHCKAVLRLEKNNYNAWVFIGVAAGELDQPEQAQASYKKAAELEPEQLLAWQGLANLYEKSNQDEFKAELPKIYQKLITLYEISDKVKYFEVSKKLVDIYQTEKNYLQVAKLWRRLIQVKETEETLRNVERLELWREMTGLLQASVEEQDNETQQHLLSAFEKALELTDNVPSEDHRQLTQDYIKCLSKLPHEVVKLKEMCETVLLLYPKDPYPLEVLGERYLISGKRIQGYTRLLEMDPVNSLAHFGLGVKALQEKKYEDAVKSFCLGQCEVYFYMTLMCPVQMADSSNDPALLALKGRAYLQKGQLEETFWVSSELLSSHPDSVEGLTLKGLAHMAKDEHHHAELSFAEALSQRPDSGELYFLLGCVYWNMGEESRRDRNKAHTHLLKAGKLDPYLGAVFRYLGHFYREVAKDPGRARGCYKKAFELDSADGEAGAATVDLSMAQGDMDSALAVLQSVTEKATPGSAKWAWMRRGLYHLKVGQHPQAIADLQAALRADPQDWVCWECLGEAYLNRHSYTASLKAFGKAHELQPDSIYSLYQTAAIKQVLGRFSEAAGEYRQIIATEEYVPALKGLGECLLALAKSAMEDYLDGRAIDLIQEYLVLQKRPDLSCLWKLLGDACTSCSTVSPNRASLLVPGPLCGAKQDQMLIQEQLLHLGERCYARALKVMGEAPGLWCDLGLNYYHQSRLLLGQPTEQVAQPLLQKALQCVKKAVMLDSGSHTHWNVLGVVAMAKGVENFALAQHSFIKSVKVEPNNAVAWTNLGTLYLTKGNIELAHEAFKIAQSLEPLYVNCWIGQALIAETVRSYDTMDLFRHTTELSTHTEGVKGYAYWVCATLLDKSNRDSELYLYNIVQMNAVSAAQVALSKYTERIQTDAEAFVMLGFLNEHLQLKKQATESYRRAVELLQNSPHTEEMSFALRGYARTLCDTGLWEEAVRHYSSTPLEELQDLTGLALACFRAGHLQESVNAYEKALAVASTEKEKAYILTSLALLQHRMGNMDGAKTLLFKCSVLKEPVPESLLCLCALGLVHGDVTLASASLSELRKMEGEHGGAVEERCLLTCTLLALQGNYSAVQREASRAVFRNPGNPTLWALLSRLVPQYCPSKADVGVPEPLQIKTHSFESPVAKRALLYSGVNQLASGRHSGEDKRKHALRTIQRAVLLCPDDPAGWAGLMAACHTENTACALTGSAPCREGLERMLMTLVSEKGSFISCVLRVSSDNPAVLLLLRQVQCERLLLSDSGTCIPPAVLEQLSAAVMANPTSVLAWHWLAEVYRSQGLLGQASMVLQQSLQLASQLGQHSGKLGSLLRLALIALTPCMAGVGGAEWVKLAREACGEVLKLGPCPLALLFQALLQFSVKMGARDTRRLLEKIVYSPTSRDATTVASVARWYLLRHLHAKDDLQLIDTLVEEAEAAGDLRLLEYHRRLYP